MAGEHARVGAHPLLKLEGHAQGIDEGVEGSRAAADGIGAIDGEVARLGGACVFIPLAADLLEVGLHLLHLVGHEDQALADDGLGQGDVHRTDKEAGENADSEEPQGIGNRPIHAQHDHEEGKDDANQHPEAHHENSKVGENSFCNPYHLRCVLDYIGLSVSEIGPIC